MLSGRPGCAMSVTMSPSTQQSTAEQRKRPSRHTLTGCNKGRSFLVRAHSADSERSLPPWKPAESGGPNVNYH